MTHPEVNYTEETLSGPDRMILHRVYRMFYKVQQETLHLIGHFVNYEFIEGSMWFTFRCYERKVPYECMVKTIDLKRGIIRHIKDYEIGCIHGD